VATGYIALSRRFGNRHGSDHHLTIENTLDTIGEGLLEGIDQPVAPFFLEYLTTDAEPERGRITLGHLLSMRSGLESTSFRNYGRWVTSPDWVGYAITRPMVSEPGGRMVYSTGDTHLAAAVLTAAAGQDLHAFARARRGEPLGIRLPPWPRDPQGIYFGGNDMRISARGLLRFGEMYRNEGAHDGRQVVPAGWVRAFESCVESSASCWAVMVVLLVMSMLVQPDIVIDELMPTPRSKLLCVMRLLDA
jgi:CubicO group peptidase (beta-lactamase class C family)